MHHLSTEEQARRKDITQAGVAQEAIDKLAELEAVGASSSDVFIENGYSLSHVLDVALSEEKRIVHDLQRMPSKDVTSAYLVVQDVKTKYAIAEFVPAPAPEPIPGELGEGKKTIP